MKIVDFYVDNKNAYLKIEDGVSFYIMVDDEEIDVPSKFDKVTEVYVIMLDDLVKIVQQEGRFPIGVKVNGEFERLEFKELLRSRVSGRYFATRWSKKKLYITTEGYLNFANLHKKELFISSQKTSITKAKNAMLHVKESKNYIELILASKDKKAIKAVNIVDFDTQKRYVVCHGYSGKVLKIDLSGIPQFGRYRVIIDTETSEKIESLLVKMAEDGTVEELIERDELTEDSEIDKKNRVEESIPFWRIVAENESFILYSTREEVCPDREEIVVHSVDDASGNCIELGVNLNRIGITGVRTRYKSLNKNIELDYNYSDQKLKIDFSELNGFVGGDFWIYVRDEKGNYYQLCYDVQPIESEMNRYFFLYATEMSARYAYFSSEGYLRYIIKAASSYQKLNDKTIRFNNLCFINNFFQIELIDHVPVEDVILGDNEKLNFYQNGKMLFVKVPNEESIVETKYLSISARNQLYKLGSANLVSDVSVDYGLVLFTGWLERLALKPIGYDFYVTTRKFSKIAIEIPNIRTEKNLELIIKNDAVEIERVIAINRKTLSVKELSFKQKKRILVIRPGNFESFIIESVVNYVLDIVFVTSEGLSLPLVENHKQLADNFKKQPWQISEKQHELLHRIYINIPGTLSISVKDNYYAENWEKVSVRDRVILYETQNGKKIADSGYAIFKYLVDNPQFSNYEHIWVIDNEKSKAPQALEEKYQKACKLVIRGTQEHKKALLEAKYLINSHTFESYFAKKADQVYINTWHGTAIKTLGYDVLGETSNVRNVVRNFMMSDYIISPNAHMTNIFAEGYKLSGIYQGTILEGGYPRNDVIKTDDTSIIIQKLQHFSVKYCQKKPTIFYAPTWRGSDVATPLNQIPELKKIIACLQSSYCTTHNILLKVHPFIFELAWKENSLRNLLIPDYLEVNEIFSIVDIMIADFSSIFFDFLITDRPVVFYIPDNENYTKNRGVYLDFDDLPGPQATNYEQLKKEINRIITGKKNKYLAKYKAMKNKYLFYDDGNTTEKYVNRIFKNEKSDMIKEISVNSNKKKLLMYMGDMNSNGITASALNLLNNLDYSKYDVTVMMYLQRSENSLTNIERINKNARVMFTFGIPLYTSEEISKDEKLLLSDFGNWEEIVTGYRKNMSYRVFPNMFFDVAVEFCGYGVASVRHMLSVEANKHIIYLHSEMGRDARKMMNGKFIRINNFNTIFKLYSQANKLVSVSKSLMKENTRQLSDFASTKQMKFARNIINYEDIIEKSKEDIDLSNLKSIYNNPVFPIDISTGLNFVTSGRLSVEKNQISLVRAFARFEKDYPGARLFILGEGPLQSAINKEVVDLKMLGKITMLGHFDNPFAFINKINYFVFPSLYEGQGLALLEALVLGKKAMASNTPASIEMLNDGEYGLIAKGTTPDALVDGLKALVKQLDFKRFDYVAYNKKAISDFNKLVE